MTFSSRFNAQSLDSHHRHLAVKEILSAALEAADPAQAVSSALVLEQGLLNIGEQSFLLEEVPRLYIVAIGKAAPAMASAAQAILGNSLSDGIVVSKYAPEHDLGEMEICIAGHPLPDERSVAAGDTILELISQCTKDDLVIFLISGGGSALMTAPVEGISLNDLGTLTSHLLRSGARIDEINILRRELDLVKGGGLAQAAYPAQIASLLLSDVVDSPLEAIASGPTVPNPTTQADALAVLKKYGLLEKVPPPILAALLRRKKNGRNVNVAAKNTMIIGSNQISAEAAKERATHEGFETHILTTSLQGEASEKGRELADYLRNTKQRPLCVIVGGETTVSLGDAKGLGGRNQEMALAAVEILSGAQDMMFITLATDGEDGPTGAAGAVVTGETFARAKELGLELDAHLHEHNAYPFFEALGDLLIPGPTGTNVNDLAFLFAF